MIIFKRVAGFIVDKYLQRCIRFTTLVVSHLIYFNMVGVKYEILITIMLIRVSVVISSSSRRERLNSRYIEIRCSLEMDLSPFEDAVTLYDIRCPFAGRKRNWIRFLESAGGVRSARSQNIHFTFSGAVGWKDTANMPGTGSMDGSQSCRWTRTMRGTDTMERKRTRGGQIEGGKERIGRAHRVEGSIVNSRVGSSWRCILHSHIHGNRKDRQWYKGKERNREREGERKRTGWDRQMADESRGLVIIEWAGVVSLRDFMRHRPCHALPHLASPCTPWHSRKCARVDQQRPAKMRGELSGRPASTLIHTVLNPPVMRTDCPTGPLYFSNNVRNVY